MSKEELFREFNSLPPEGQRLVSDFIASLQSRYKKSEREKRPKRTDITKEKFIGMWHDREDMKDNNAWVRNLRKGDWKK